MVDHERGVVGCRRGKWCAESREGRGKYDTSLALGSSALTEFFRAVFVERAAVRPSSYTFAAAHPSDLT